MKFAKYALLLLTALFVLYAIPLKPVHALVCPYAISNPVPHDGSMKLNGVPFIGTIDALPGDVLSYTATSEGDARGIIIDYTTNNWGTVLSRTI